MELRRGWIWRFLRRICRVTISLITLHYPFHRYTVTPLHPSTHLMMCSQSRSRKSSLPMRSEIRAITV
jgi:hypothetical protein